MEIFPFFGGVLHPVISFIVSLSIIVFVHEYGHYIVGKWTGIKADVFSVGMGPVVLSRVDKNGTTWQLAAIPFGGFVKFKGDANISSSHVDPKTSAYNKRDLRATLHGAPLWARTATVAAGPVFNFVFSIIIFFSLFVSVGQVREPLTISKINPLPFINQLKEGDEIISISGFQLSSASSIKDMLEYIENIDKKSIEYEVRRDGEIFNLSGPPVDLPRISGLVPLSAAVEASLNAGDVILEINGEPINKFNQLKEAVEKSAGSPINLTVWREEKIFQTTIVPKREDIPQPEGGFITKWRIGIIGSIYPFELLTESIPVLQAIKLSFFQTYSIITSSINGLYHIIAGNISTCNLSGPIEIAEISSHMAKEGLQSFIQTLALFSAAIGFMNLLPIPVLDGGHLVFFAYEAIFKKPPNQKAFSALMTVGFAFILFFMMFAIFNDYFC
ncbi:RIP metalloprotease RseP [Paracoccaceae bacterium]|nr:RIP metalloprotease RseP [Paracoccaceae bacterium]